MRALLTLLPEEMIPLLFVAGGLALMVSARRLGGSLLALSLVLALLPALLAPLFESLPDGLLSVVLTIIFVGLAFSIVRMLSNCLIGKRSTDHMIGILAADVARAAFLSVMRLLGHAIRGVIWLALWPFRR